MDVDGMVPSPATRVGKQIHVMAGQSNLKRAWTELGGKSPNLVFADCPDLDRAVEAAVNNVFFNQGESCNAPSRLFVEESIRTSSGKALAMVPKYQPGDPLAPGTMMGAVVDRTQPRYRAGLHRIGPGARARSSVGGGSAVEPVAAAAMCSRPSSTGHQRHADRARGDLRPGAERAVLQRRGEAVRAGQRQPLRPAGGGLDARPQQGAWRGRALRAGTVHVNQYNDDDITVPFGGFRQSGVGRDKSLHAFDKYTELKTTWIVLSRPVLSGLMSRHAAQRPGCGQ